MTVTLRGHTLVLDHSGALWWPTHALLVVADLHLEKGSAFARRGRLLPPYDTYATLDRLDVVIERLGACHVVSLGDGFHDAAGPQALSAELFDRLAGLVRRVRWLWITGNHDPAVPLALGGAVLPALELDGLTLTHTPRVDAAGEIAGHLHPKARLESRQLRGTRPCFVGDDARLILPAFGAYTGGLNVLDPAFRALIPGPFTAWLLGGQRVFALPHHKLAPETYALQRQMVPVS